MTKHFNKEDYKNFESSTKFWIFDNTFVKSDVKEIDHCHKDCNSNVSLNYKIPIFLHSVINCDEHVIMWELEKFKSKINVIPNRLEKYIGFSLDNKIVFIDSFHFLGSSLDSLVKNLNKNNFKHLNWEFDNEVLDLVKPKGFCCYEHMSDFEKFKYTLPRHILGIFRQKDIFDNDLLVIHKTKLL